MAGRKPCPKVWARRAEVARLRAEGFSRRGIANRLGVQPNTVSADLRAIRNPTPADKRREDVAARKRAEVAKIRDRRRFKQAPVATGEIGRLAPPEVERTIFPNTVAGPADAPDEPILKDGQHSSKIGGDVLIGHLRGAKIFTLTLEERATCPRSCGHWCSCYGNGMPHARRWAGGPDFEARLAHEVADLCARHSRVLIRLHILGDFYSPAYVRLWGALLRAHEGLWTFGFTGWPESSGIGAEIARTRGRFGARFSIRHSGRSGRWGSFTIDFPTERNRLGDAVVCPEQRHAIEAPERRTHCGSCGLCWAGDAPIVFIEH